VTDSFITEATMHKSTTPLTPAQVYRFAVDFCQPKLDLKPDGKVTAAILLTILYAAAARISSISETCRRLAGVPWTAVRSTGPRPS
jgi:putative transposase